MQPSRGEKAQQRAHQWARPSAQQGDRLNAKPKAQQWAPAAGGYARQSQVRAALLCNAQHYALGGFSLFRCQSDWKGCWRKGERGGKQSSSSELGSKNSGEAVVPGLRAQLPSISHGFHKHKGLESCPQGKQPPSLLLSCSQG